MCVRERERKRERERERERERQTERDRQRETERERERGWGEEEVKLGRQGMKLNGELGGATYQLSTGTVTYVVCVVKL